MPHFNFDNTDIPIRPDLPKAFRAVWDHIAIPGPQWSSAQRVAIAQEARQAETCALCVQRAQALSPNAVQGQHDHASDLPEPTVDIIHRISIDPGRLPKSFYEESVPNAVTDAQWVEIIGIVSSLKSIDTFHQALGFPPEPLPKPSDAKATQYRPEGATIDGGWVPMLKPDNLAEPEKMIYGGAPRVPNVFRSMSLVPDEVRNLGRISAAMYLHGQEVADPNATGDRAIDRTQMELIAARVSAVNECFY